MRPQPRDAAHEGSPALIKTRVAALFFLFVLWGIAVTARLSQYMIFQRSHFLADVLQKSVLQGEIPAMRGRLLDRKGTPLAWSSRHFSLVWHIPRDTARALSAWQEISTWQQILHDDWSESDILAQCGTVRELVHDLDAEAVLKLQNSVGSIPGLRLQSSFVRHYSADHQIRQALGNVVVLDGTERGMSGAELDHDALLQGVSGLYTVMVDRHGQWLPETWRSLRDVRPGYDVYLPLRHRKEAKQ